MTHAPTVKQSLFRSLIECDSKKIIQRPEMNWIEEDRGYKDTHSDIGFQLAQFPGKMAKERQRERSKNLKMFQQCFFCTSAVHERAAAESGRRKGLGGSIVEPAWKQTKEIGTAWAKVQNCRRYVSRASSTHITGNVQRLRWSLTARIPSDPLLNKSFETQTVRWNP